MKHVSILIPEGNCSLTNIEGTHHILSEVNTFLARRHEPPAFKIQLVGLHKQPAMKKGMFRIYPDVVIGEVEKTDLIIIPAIQEASMVKGIEMNRAFIPWLIKQHEQGAALASLCIGAFLLAATGLLKGKQCSTHWAEAKIFREMFPDVDLVPEKIITDEHGIYSSGGAFSSMNLVLYLVEKYAGRDMAILCSKVFQIEMERNSQSCFMIFNPQKEHEDEAVKKAQAYIEKNFQEKITIDQLAQIVLLSRRNLERRFKKATSNTTVEYIQRVKIEAAKISLEKTRDNVNEVMYSVGYNDTKAFRTTFKKITGLSPIQYRGRYRAV